MLEVNLDSIEVITICNHDHQLSKLISLIGNLKINNTRDRFEGLVHSIVGQLLSLKAASTISSRLNSLINHDVTPDQIGLITDEQLRTAGLSKRKVLYIRDLCEKVTTGQIDLTTLQMYSNEEIIKALTNIKGIGKWTAEMFLIFSLGRLDILSLDDVSLQRASKWVYGVSKDVDGKKLLADKGEHWKPYQSIASFYLWEAVNRGYVDKFPSLEKTVF